MWLNPSVYLTNQRTLWNLLRGLSCPEEKRSPGFGHVQSPLSFRLDSVAPPFLEIARKMDRNMDARLRVLDVNFLNVVVQHLLSSHLIPDMISFSTNLPTFLVERQITVMFMVNVASRD